MPSVLPLQHHAEAEVRRHRGRLQARLLPGAVLEVADVLRQPAHRRHDQRPGQLGRRDRRADAFGDRDAEPRAGLDVDVRADPAGLRDQLAACGSFSSSWRGNCVRSRISTSTSASRSRTESWPMPLTVLVKTLALRLLELRGALQLAHRVLVVVEDDDVHGAAGSCGPSAGAATHCARLARRRLACADSDDSQETLDGDLDAFGQRADLRAHARQHRRPGSTRPRRMPQAKKFEPVGATWRRAWRPTCCRSRAQIQIACDAAKFCVARLAGVEAPKFEDNETTLRRAARSASRKTIDYVQSVPAGADRRQRRQARSRCRGATATAAR